MPVDVQALYVPPGGDEKMVRLPICIGGHGVKDPEDGMPDPFSEGVARPAGVHLHWAMPDALLRGTLEQRDDGAANRLGAAGACPTAGSCCASCAPKGREPPVVRGWVIEADRRASSRSSGAKARRRRRRRRAGRAVPPEGLTGTVGGSLNWAARTTP